MKPKWHILFGFMVSYILVLFGWISLTGGIIVFLSSVLIDVDHYLWYVWKKKDFNLGNAIKWYYQYEKHFSDKSKEEKEKYEFPAYIFHSLIFWLIILILGLKINVFFIWVLIGIGIHIVADFFVLRYHRVPWYLKVFPCFVMLRNKNKKSLTI